MYPRVGLLSSPAGDLRTKIRMAGLPPRFFTIKGPHLSLCTNLSENREMAENCPRTNERKMFENINSIIYVIIVSHQFSTEHLPSSTEYLGRLIDLEQHFALIASGILLLYVIFKTSRKKSGPNHL